MIRWLTSVLFGEDDTAATLDHVPVQRDAKKDWRDRAVKKARERHGREFHSHTPKPRETEPSRDLQELDAASRPAEPVILLDDHRAAR